MLEAIFKNSSQQIVLKYKTQLEQINGLEDNLKLFTDLELKEQTTKLKNRLLKGETKYSILPEAFALIREASRRVLGLRLFDVQLIGGIVLTEGKIAEMKTGEGKTLVSTLPAYYNASLKKGVHIITVNEYLAERDQKWMGEVYRFLNTNVGLVKEQMNVRMNE